MDIKRKETKFRRRTAARAAREAPVDEATVGVAVVQRAGFEGPNAKVNRVKAFFVRGALVAGRAVRARAARKCRVAILVDVANLGAAVHGGITTGVWRS